MNHGPTIFLGIFLTFAAAWMGLVFAPYAQLGGLPPVAVDPDDPAAGVYPRPLSGLAARGREVYRANGCVYCHSQQIRPEGFGTDIDRGWGPRRTVPRDYLYDKPHLMGTMRTGPDLTNIGVRRSGADGAAWHHLHLYNPRITSPGSTMPSFRFLYDTRRAAGQPSRGALAFPEGSEIEPGMEVVPGEEARALVAYLMALDRTAELEEAEAPPAPR